MSNATTTSTFSFLKVAIPASVVILAGLSLVYSIRGGDPAGNAAGNLAESTDSITIAKSPLAESQPVVHRHLGTLIAPGSLRPTALSADGTETAPALARLHKAMADVRTQQADRDRLVGDLDRQHKAEPVDARWSAESEVGILSASIEPVMTESGLRPQDLVTDCRSSTCRISARFAESSDAASWGNLLVTQVGGTISQARMTIVTLLDGSSEVRIYGTRNDAPRGQ